MSKSVKTVPTQPQASAATPITQEPPGGARQKNWFLTQDDDKTEPDEPAIVRHTSYATNKIKVLTETSFTLEDKMLIGLKYDDCIIVLFHTENKESHSLMKIYYLVAEQTPGPIYAECNVLLHNKVAEAFARVKMDGSHPLNPYSLHQWPVIIVYRKGMPVAVYNGESDVQTIIDWSLLLACRANYFEPIQEFASMQAEFRHDMPTPLIYPDDKLNPEAKVSSQFRSTQSKRGFYKFEHPVRSGTKDDEREALEVHELRLERAGVKPTKAELMKGVKVNPETRSEEEVIQEIRTQEQEEEAEQPPAQPGRARPRTVRSSPVETPAPPKATAKPVPQEAVEEEVPTESESEEGGTEGEEEGSVPVEGESETEG